MARRQNPKIERTLRRTSSLRLVKQTFLIVCEGEVTEPEYFNSFRLTSANVKAIVSEQILVIYLPFLSIISYSIVTFRDTTASILRGIIAYLKQKYGKTTRLHLPKSYLTIHSNNPAALSSGNSTSKRKALVFTGLKFTVQAAPLSVG